MGEERYLFRELELELECSKLLWYVRFRWPLLLLPLPIWSEKRAALRGELIRVLVLAYGNSDVELEEEESENISPLDLGRLRFGQI